MTYLAKLVLEVDYLCVFILKNTSDVKVAFTLPSITRGGVDLGPTEERTEAGIQVAARKTGPEGNAASRRACAT